MSPRSPPSLSGVKDDGEGVGVQDKLVQKRHFQGAGVPVADFMGVDDPAAAAAAAQAFGFPFMLKARRWVALAKELGSTLICKAWRVRH